MHLYPLALVAGLLPLITIHICYLWAASNGHVDWCIPYIDSCSSISAAGRKPPEYYLFKALMIPSAVFLATYWWLSCRWLNALGCTAHRRRALLLGIALLASAGLILYSVMLGSIGDIYRLQRRIGVTGFFGMTYLAQLLLTYLLGKTSRIRDLHGRGLKALELMALTILTIGIISIMLSVYDYELYKRTDNAFEWTLTLLLCVHVIISSVLWRKTYFTFDTQVRL